MKKLTNNESYWQGLFLGNALALDLTRRLSGVDAARLNKKFYAISRTIRKNIDYFDSKRVAGSEYNPSVISKNVEYCYGYMDQLVAQFEIIKHIKDEKLRIKELRELRRRISSCNDMIKQYNGESQLPTT